TGARPRRSGCAPPCYWSQHDSLLSSLVAQIPDIIPRRRRQARTRTHPAHSTTPSVPPIGGITSCSEHTDRLADPLRAPFEGGAFDGGQVDLDHLLEAIPSQVAGYAEEQAAHPVLPFEPGRAGQ